MDQSTYNVIVNEVKNGVYSKLNKVPAISDFEYLLFLQTRANVSFFCKTIKYESEFEFYKKVLFNQKLASKDSELVGLLDLVEIRDEHSSKSPVNLYLSFHLGSYRLILKQLFVKLDKLLLIVNDEQFKLSYDKFMDIHKEFTKKYKCECDFKVLNAEAKNIGIQLIREVRNGYNLFIYQDGNTGVGGMSRSDDKLVSINFFGRKIYVRKGVAFISHVLNIPIIPVFSYRKPDFRIIFNFSPPIYPNKELKREDYAEQVLQNIFNKFQSLLVKYPDQWDGWLYVNQFCDPEYLKSLSTVNVEHEYSKDNIYAFNVSRYRLFIMKETGYLLDNKILNAVKIPPPLFNLILKIENKTIKNQQLHDLLKKDLFNNLIKREILSPVNL